LVPVSENKIATHVIHNNPNNQPGFLRWDYWCMLSQRTKRATA
jgi:hypothetical protein